MAAHKVEIRVVDRNFLSRFVRKLFKRNSVANTERKSVVKPRELQVRRGDSVEFNAVDNNDVAIFIPYEELLEGDSLLFELNDPNSFKTTVNVERNAQRGEYVYTVYSKNSNDLANKPPKMIVK